jgi:16S rRNA (cytosine967-C5)-methyltransferase
VRVLDYCAGGGGKSLALAAWLGASVDAHDIDVKRMRDIPVRATRAGVQVTQKARKHLSKGAYDVIFVDAPCSGSGTWRRAPAAKWDMTPEKLEQLQNVQGEILQSVTPYLKPDGVLIYVTCSIFNYENQSVVTDFLTKNTTFEMIRSHQFLPTDLGDGFYFASLRHKI